MKKLLFSLLTSFVPLSVVAQSDISIVFNTPMEGSTITSGEAFNLNFEVVNAGSNNVFAGDTIFLAYSIGNQIVEGSARYLTLTEDLAPNGASGNIGSEDTSLTFSGLEGNAEFCLVVVYGPVNDSFAETDPNKVNNTSCKTFYFTGGANVSIDEEERILNSVYPNPVSTSVYFDIPKANTVEIYDISGRMLKKIYFTDGQQQEVSLEDFSSGMYVYRVKNIENEIILSDKFYVVK